MLNNIEISSMADIYDYQCQLKEECIPGKVFRSKGNVKRTRDRVVCIPTSYGLDD
jgi:hypothetical protein